MTPLSDITMMKRALFLAEKGCGYVAPNPMVGCVLVKNNIVIGQGYHQKYGQAHAEVNAVQSVKNQQDIKGATAYVTLEPCHHTGNTPPCTALLIKHGIKKVVIAQQDVNQKVNGKGIQALRNANIEVVMGVCTQEAEFLNRRFNLFHQKKRPYIILKWAETYNGFLQRDSSLDDPSHRWISCPASRKLTHLWRAEESAILVGRKTVLTDNPHLGVRDWVGGLNPVRIIIDPHNRLHQAYQVFNQKIKTIKVVYQSSPSKTNDGDHDASLDCLPLPEDNFLGALMTQLYQRKILSVLVEGGSYTLQSFLNENLWDECRIFTSQIHRGGSCKAPLIPVSISVSSKTEISTVDHDQLQVIYR